VKEIGVCGQVGSLIYSLYCIPHGIPQTPNDNINGFATSRPIFLNIDICASAKLSEGEDQNWKTITLFLSRLKNSHPTPENLNPWSLYQVPTQKRKQLVAMPLVVY
jgi:hypothetical protein